MGLNIALGYQGKGSKLPIYSVKTPQTALLASKTSLTTTTPENAQESEIQKSQKTLEEVLIPEEKLEIRREAVCSFLESERPEKFRRTEICR